MVVSARAIADAEPDLGPPEPTRTLIPDSVGRQRRWLRQRRLAIVVAIVAVFAGLGITVPSTWVLLRSRDRVFVAGDAPSAPVAIVFGAAVSNGEPGSFLRGRLDTALRLYDAGSIGTIIISGNAMPPYDDEIAVMRTYLQDRGVHSERLIDDPQGSNTDSTCRRASTVYGVRRALLVTQDFHASRAVALCRSWGIDAYGVIAECPCTTRSLLRNDIRETLLSRPAAFLYAQRV